MNIVCEVDSSTVYVRSDSKDPDQSTATLVRRTDLAVTTPDVASQVDALVILKAKVSCAKTVVANFGEKYHDGGYDDPANHDPRKEKKPY